MDIIEQVKVLVEKEIPGSIVKTKNLTGNHSHLHLGILVVSEKFEGMMLIDQHQMIMDLLKEDLKEAIHAVQIKTMTPKKYERVTNQGSM